MITPLKITALSSELTDTKQDAPIPTIKNPMINASSNGILSNPFKWIPGPFPFFPIPFKIIRPKANNTAIQSGMKIGAKVFAFIDKS